MTTTPVTVDPSDSLEAASKLMHEHNIRHLPALRDGKLVGILSSRDVALIETLKDVDPKKVTVEDAMTANPYVVSPDALITDVATEMAEKKYGAALIAQNDHLVGVFTAVDACRVLAEVFETRLK